MKNLSKIIIIAAIAIIATSTVQAQVRFGVKGGVTINELKWDKEIFSSDNRMGFTGGLMLEIGMPIVGLGIDASVLYTHRENELYLEG